MKRTLGALGLAAALGAVAAPAAARADTLVNQQFCGGNTFNTCAFISSSTSLNGSGNTVLTLTVTNPVGNNAGSVFTAVGIANLPSGATVTGGTASGAGTSFTFAPGGPSGLSGAGIESDVVGFGAEPPAPTNGINVGESATFTFTFNGAYNLGAIQYSLHDQGGAPQGCEASTKLVINGSVAGGYTANVGPCGPPPPPPPPTTVPEPASLMLLASGLASIGGTGVIRRRRK